jgi:type III secretory pathway component EscV
MGNVLSYSERMKERNRIISEIDPLQLKLESLKEKTREKRKLEKKINKLKEKYIRNGIRVPENEGYEISNGLLGMKRDINLKLTDKLDDDKIKQV